MCCVGSSSEEGSGVLIGPAAGALWPADNITYIIHIHTSARLGMEELASQVNVDKVSQPG